MVAFAGSFLVVADIVDLEEIAQSLRGFRSSFKRAASAAGEVAAGVTYVLRWPISVVAIIAVVAYIHRYGLSAYEEALRCGNPEVASVTAPRKRNGIPSANSCHIMSITCMLEEQ